MILVDTCVWIDHIRRHDTALAGLLTHDKVLTHPVVTGELALGRLRNQDRLLDDLANLIAIDVATDDEVLTFIRRNALAGSGIGYADAHLLAAARLTPETSLWTRDRRLMLASRRLGLDANIEPYSGVQEE